MKVGILKIFRDKFNILYATICLYILVEKYGQGMLCE